MKRLIVLFYFLIISVSLTAAPVKEVVLKVESSPSPWVKCGLDEKIELLLSRADDARIYQAENLAVTMPDFPQAVHNLDSLINWGMETGYRYLLFIRVDDENIQRRKTFNLPLIAQRYESVGVISGELKLVDVSRSKLLLAEPFTVKKSGKSIFQASTEDDIHDSSIHLTSPEKLRFFDELEDKVAEHIVKRVKRGIGVR